MSKRYVIVEEYIEPPVYGPMIVWRAYRRGWFGFPKGRIIVAAETRSDCVVMLKDWLMRFGHLA